MSCKNTLTSECCSLTSGLVKPQPRIPILVRAATLDDLEAIDALQKMSTHALGFLTRGALTGYITDPTREVLVAEMGADRTGVSPGRPEKEGMLGYIIGRDSYYSNDRCGYISQLNVHPDHRRSLIGAKLVEAMFERAAYGCVLFACWCAQDLPANRFWESIGFVPIAFRTGSARTAGKERIHIFWQKRIREGDTGTASGGTAYWFPSKTRGGQIGSDRVALPIPPGTHWSDAKPMVIPGVANVPMFMEPNESEENRLALEEAKALTKKVRENDKKKKAAEAKGPKKRKPVKRQPHLISSGGLRFPSAEEINAAKQAGDSAAQAEKDREQAKKARKKAREAKKRKYHPDFLKAAREFRDRFLESAQAAGGESLIADPGSVCKYDVSRRIESGVGLEGLLSGGDGNENAGPLPALTADFAGSKAGDEHDDDAINIINAEFTLLDDGTEVIGVRDAA